MSMDVYEDIFGKVKSGEIDVEKMIATMKDAEAAAKAEKDQSNKELDDARTAVIKAWQHYKTILVGHDIPDDMLEQEFAEMKKSMKEKEEELNTIIPMVQEAAKKATKILAKLFGEAEDQPEENDCSPKENEATPAHMKSEEEETIDDAVERFFNSLG